jgi:hypothetical protein
MFLFYAAEGQGPLHGTVHDLPEYERALEELDDAHLRPAGTGDAYWQRIRAKLLSESSSQDLATAIKEWARKGAPYWAPHSHCELCGKEPIAWNFPIQNKIRKRTLHIGSECIVNFLNIHYKTDVERLRSLISNEIKILKRRQEGVQKGGEIVESSELADLEASLRAMVHAAGTGGDFHIFKHMVEVNNGVRVLNALKIDSAARSDAMKAVNACIEIRQLATRLKLPSSDNTGVMEIVQGILTKRGNKGKAEQLQTLKSQLGKVFQGRAPNDVIIRIYDDLAHYRTGLVSAAHGHVERLKTNLREKYHDVLTTLSSYEYLSFVMEAGIGALRDAYATRLKEYEVGVMDRGLVERIIANPAKYPADTFDVTTFFPEADLRSNPDARARAAANVVEFVHDVRQGHWKPMLKVASLAFQVMIKDEAGFQAAVYQAADDSLILPEEKGGKAIQDLGRLIEMHNPKLVTILIDAVDDLHSVRVEKVGLKVVERMSHDLGFNVAETFRRFDADAPGDRALCERLLAEWQGGRKPSASEVREFVSRKGSPKAHYNMFDALHEELNATLGPTSKTAAAPRFSLALGVLGAFSHSYLQGVQRDTSELLDGVHRRGCS